MYFFDPYDYYSVCYFGKSAHTGTLDTNGEPHYISVEIAAGATFEAYMNALQKYIMDSSCPTDASCSAQDQTVIDNFNTAHLNFLIERKIFFNAYKNPDMWGFPAGVYPPALTGIVNTSISRRDITTTTGNPNSFITVFNVPINYGTGQFTLASIDTYKQSFKNLDCEIKKLLSYFTGMDFSNPSLNNYYQMTYADL